MITIVLLVIIVVYPFETTVVPAWGFRVVDEEGKPYVGKQVRQLWKHYSLEFESGQNGEFQVTDSEGFVSFPERTIRASLLWRMIVPAIKTVLTLAHGSTGIDAYVSTSGPQGYKSVEYVPGKPLPERIVLPRKDKEPETNSP